MRPTGQKKNEPLRCVFLVLLSATDMSKYTRLMEEIFSALISCVIGPGRAAPSPAAERARRAAARARNARRRASGAAGRKLSWNGKRWAVAVAGPRPTVDRENRGGVGIRVHAYLAFWSAFWS